MMGRGGKGRIGLVTESLGEGVWDGGSLAIGIQSLKSNSQIADFVTQLA